ncbi:MAG: energy-coupling factor transporter transmembrane component T [Christensenellales bacterium]|jgi:energy-coupling factor transport system permease protein
MKTFASYHPAVLAAYFIGVLLISMFSLNPVAVALSLAGGILFFAAVSRAREFFGSLAFYACLFMLIALTNPLFNDGGVTPLFFLNGRPVTCEAIAYGMAASGMLISVMFWCKCCTLVMTPDKFVYLFGKVIPKLSLVLSMALRFIPMMKRQAGRIRAAQKSLGLYTDGRLTARLAGEMRVFGALLCWALENAVETADAMKARGYGLKGRSHFSLFVFRKRDVALLAVTAGIFVLALIGMHAGALRFAYYPAVTRLPAGPLSLLTYGLLALWMLMPFIMESEEFLRWKYLRSRI